MTSIKNRTSIRKYSTKEVSDELLNQLLEDAMRTPTMGNLQLYPDIYQSGRRSRTWYLFFGNNSLYAKDDYRHIETS